MPIGMKNTGAILVRGLRMLISDLENVGSYIDDLIVYAEDWDTHIRVLDELMNRLQQANLTAGPTKCVFGAKSVEFLGYQAGFDWITVNDDNLVGWHSDRQQGKTLDHFWNLRITTALIFHCLLPFRHH